MLKAQHEEIKGLLAGVADKSGEERVEQFTCLVRLLAAHETAEEEVVHPVARASSPEGEAIVARRLQEEDEADTALADLEKLGPDDAEFVDKFQAFTAAVLAHAEAEENEEFPLLANRSAAEGERMGAAVAIAEGLAPTHSHPHGPQGAVGDMIVGPFATMVGRVRDALKHRP